MKLTDLIKDGTHFSERHGDTIHVVNSLTGERIVMRATALEVPTHLELREQPDGSIVKFEVDLPTPPLVPVHLAYNPVIIDEMCAKIVEGASVTTLCKDPRYPTYAQLSRWRRAYADIDLALDRAKRDRAEVHADKVMELAENVTEDDVNSTKVKIEAQKWRAAVDAPERYSPKAKIEATLSAPTQIVVYTGIDREPVHVQDSSTTGVAEGK